MQLLLLSVFTEISDSRSAGEWQRRATLLCFLLSSTSVTPEESALSHHRINTVIHSVFISVNVRRGTLEGMDPSGDDLRIVRTEIQRKLFFTVEGFFF